MTQKQNDGGPAFPCAARQLDTGEVYNEFVPGMSKLEWFAGMALASGVLDVLGRSDEPADQLRVAVWCFDTAELMLAESERRKGEHP